MKFCKKCGTLYGCSLGVCPRCNAKDVAGQAEQAEQSQAAASAKTVKRQWIAILLGVPGLILFLYLVLGAFKALSAH